MQINTEQKNVYTVECFDAEGKSKWFDTIHNLVTDEGLNEQLLRFWKGAGYTASFFVGLISATPTVAAGDTLASHGGWTESAAYAETTRAALVLGSVAGKSVNNSASKAVFTINATVTLGGVMITTNSTKSGTAGLLIAVGAFDTGNKSLVSGDTINVTVNLGNASA